MTYSVRQSLIGRGGEKKWKNSKGRIKSYQKPPGEALFIIEGFQEVWAVAMIFFVIHLCLIAFLVWRPGMFSRIIAILLGIAGVGYLVDNLAFLLSPTYTLEIIVFTFIGEVIFIVWLFILGGKNRAENYT